VKLDVAQSWFSDGFAQDTMRGFIVASSSANSGGDLDGSTFSSAKAPYNMAMHGELRGLDREQRLVYHERVVCLFLTDHQLIVTSVRGQFKVKPNEVLHTIDRAGLRCEWFDYQAAGNHTRNFVIRIPDDTWLAVGTGTKILGKENKMAAVAENFTEQLGATEIDWRNPPPL